MAFDSWNYSGRKPRHQVSDPDAVTVRLSLAGAERAAGVTVELIDFARTGARLRTADSPGEVAFKEGDAVIVRLTSQKSRLDFDLPAVVRWQRAEGPGTWLLGCEFMEVVSLETLGELFLNQILSDDRSVGSQAGN
jgi:hypothetical protein